MQHPELLLSTENREAFERVTSGLKHLEAYKKSKQWVEVSLAASDLEAAVQIDPDYTAARYYAGIADDLAGRAADGADVLAPLLAQPLDDKFRRYVRYALGLAEYHQYHPENLVKAAGILYQLLAESPDYALKTSTYALLAQVHAMQEISMSTPAAPIAEVVSMSEKSAAARQHALELLSAPEAKTLQPQVKLQLNAMLENALGMSEMYRADVEEKGKLQRLNVALRHLEVADHAIPDDWANTCDLGSVHMRFGIVTGNVHEFDEARRLLLHVVEKLRPEYGFALYEIGRTYRVQGKFDEALVWFERAKAVPKRYRDVSDRRVDREIERARDKKFDYP